MTLNLTCFKKQLIQRIIVIIMILESSSVLLTAETIRVATFNVKNYLVTDRMVDGTFYRDYPKPEADKTLLRATIKKGAADILALQEMGSVPFLKELQDDLKADGVAYPYSVVIEAVDPERHTAILSKLPFDKVVSNDHLRFKYFGKNENVKRGLLEVHFSTNKTSWILFNLHLKSRLTNRREDPQSFYFRQGEARAIANYIDQSYPLSQKPFYLITGDLNDTTRSKTIKTLCGHRKRPRAQLINCFDSDNEAWTYHYYKEDTYYRFDYFIASTALKDRVKNNRGFIIKGDQGSDHRMVYIDLVFE